MTIIFFEQAASNVMFENRLKVKHTQILPKSMDILKLNILEKQNLEIILL